MTLAISSRLALAALWVPRRFLQNFKARLSLEIRSNSRHLFFIWSKSHNFPDNGFAESLVLGYHATFPGLSIFMTIELSNFVALIWTGDESVGEGHFFSVSST